MVIPIRLLVFRGRQIFPQVTQYARVTVLPSARDDTSPDVALDGLLETARIASEVEQVLLERAAYHDHVVQIHKN
jgi:hypothetical protein